MNIISCNTCEHFKYSRCELKKPFQECLTNGKVYRPDFFERFLTWKRKSPEFFYAKWKLFEGNSGKFKSKSHLPDELFEI